MKSPEIHGVYGTPPAELATVPTGAVQFSPLIPGSQVLEKEQGTLASLVMLAPPGTVERRYALAAALCALQPGGELIGLAPKDKGGARLAGELAAFGVDANEVSKRHHRICTATRPEKLSAINEALDEGAPRILPDLGLWSQPGVFAFDRMDPGTRLLIDTLPVPAPRGADFGCGIGFLSRAVLMAPGVTELTLIDIDRRAVACAEHNVVDPRARFVWADIRKGGAVPAGLDFIVTNPPFHDGGAEDRALGRAFIEEAATSLREGGSLWLVANRHLPYEETLRRSFARVRLVAEQGGYKIYEAVR